MADTYQYDSGSDNPVRRHLCDVGVCSALGENCAFIHPEVFVSQFATNTVLHQQNGNYHKKVMKSTYSSFKTEGGLSKDLEELKRGPSELEMERALSKESRDILNSISSTNKHNKGEVLALLLSAAELYSRNCLRNKCDFSKRGSLSPVWVRSA